MTMDKNRFDELKLDGLEIECPHCDIVSSLKWENTTGGGYGVIGIKCDICKRTFTIDGGA